MTSARKQELEDSKQFLAIDISKRKEELYKTYLQNVPSIVHFAVTMFSLVALFASCSKLARGHRPELVWPK